LCFRGILVKFGSKPNSVPKFTINDPNILNEIRLGNSKAVNDIKPELIKMIRKKLSTHRLNSRELRETIFTDIYLDLFNKKRPIVLTVGPAEFLSGMVERLIKKYVVSSKLILLDADKMNEFPDSESLDKDEVGSLLWLKLLPFVLKLPRKSRDLVLRLHDEVSSEQICKEMGFKNENTLNSRKSQTKLKLKRMIERSSGNEWLKSKLKKTK
jgi:DNA-directed RNA polymerase specialized sigma24 family protein